MRKKLFAILMSAMMMVTFMPAMAFAGEEETTPKADYVVSSIDWAADNTYATVVAYDTATHSKTFKVKSLFGKGEYSDTLFLSREALPKVDKFYTLNGYDYDFDVPLKLKSKLIKEDVIDLTKIRVTLENGHEVYGFRGAHEWQVDAGNYSAWYENMSNKSFAGNSYAVKTVEFDDHTYFGKKDKDDPNAYSVKDYLNVEYPEYNAYDYTTETGTVKVSLNAEGEKVVAGWAEGIPNYYGKAELTVRFLQRGLNDYYTAWTVDGAKGNAVIYDGKDHAVTKKAALNTKSVYAMKSFGLADVLEVAKTVDLYELVLGDQKAEMDKLQKAVEEKFTVKFEDADYTETAPSVKEVGVYVISVKTDLLDKDGKVVETAKDQDVYVVTPRPVAVYGQTITKTKSYDGTGLTIEDSDFDIRGLLDGEKLFTSAYVTKADAGKYNMSITKDTLFSVLTNINPHYFPVAMSTLKFEGVITKADNVARIGLVSKTVKASAVKKASKSYSVKASASFGKVKVAKMSGSSKLTIKNGKLVVKKGTKKGTYKIKVKAYVEGNANYASCKRIKTLTVKVK